MSSTELIPREIIEQKIFIIRGHKVMLDRHLAELYHVQTMRLNEQVKRNIKRFPPDFMFQLTPEENQRLISHFAISKKRGGYRKLPYVFTEQGVAMLSSVLNSERAIEVNVAIIRTFVRLRKILTTHVELARKLEELERKYDAQLKIVFDILNQLMQPPEKPKRRIGFQVEEPRLKYAARKK